MWNIREARVDISSGFKKSTLILNHVLVGIIINIQKAYAELKMHFGSFKDPETRTNENTPDEKRRADHLFE